MFDYMKKIEKGGIVYDKQRQCIDTLKDELFEAIKCDKNISIFRQNPVKFIHNIL